MKAYFARKTPVPGAPGAFKLPSAGNVATCKTLRRSSSDRFKLPRAGDVASVLRADLKAAGIPYRDDAGRVADFHALRHAFITNLARSGVHPKTAQTLARHSSITLTMDRYSHSVVGDLVDALNALPDPSSIERRGQRATGTDGRADDPGAPGPGKASVTPTDTNPTRELAPPFTSGAKGAAPGKGRSTRQNTGKTPVSGARGGTGGGRIRTDE